jgi:signal transduction histidine kinase
VALLAADNASRHASATRIAIGVSRGPSRTRLTIIDDGTGFDPGRRGAQGRGLRDMAAEAARLGGTLAVTSRTPGSSGTSVELEWPDQAIAGNPASGHGDLPAGDGAERA